MYMSFFALSALVNAATSLILGLAVLRRDITNRVNVLFAFFAFAITAWSLAYFFWQISVTAEDALRWVQLLMAAAIFIPAFYFHFVAAFLDIDRRKWLIVAFAYIFSIGFLLINFTPLFIQEVVPKAGFLFWPEPGHFYIYFLAIWFFYVVYALYFLSKKAFSGTRTEMQIQARYVLIGTLIGYIGGSTNYLLWYDVPIAPYGNILVTAYVIMVAYAILKHHLFSLKVIATELLIFALWIFIFVQTALADTLEEQIINGGLLFITLVVGVLLVRSVRREVATRKEIEHLAQNLKSANERLKELDQLKSEFVSIASHQLRSPLTAIKGYASMVLEGSYGTLPSGTKDAISKIFESSKLMTSSVEDFLNVSRIEQGRMKYEFSQVDISDIAKTSVDDLKSVASQKDLTLSFNKDVGKYVTSVDLGKMKQIFTNLIDNAIKYTKEGTVSVNLSRDGKKITATIKDTGVGISKEVLPKLFDKFVRARNANKVNVSGTGLGLYVAKELVEAHHGRIWAESEGEGKGTTFFIEIPVR